MLHDRDKVPVLPPESDALTVSQSTVSQWTSDINGVSSDINGVSSDINGVSSYINGIIYGIICKISMEYKIPGSMG